MNPLFRIGLLGCGVVGGGVVEALYLNADYVEARSGARFEVVRIAVRDLQRLRTPHVNHKWLCDDWESVCRADDVDIVVEAMGGITPAFEAVQTALSCGKHVVSANKELLARYGEELYRTAAEHNVSLLFEASVMGGVPVLYALQTYFHANRVKHIRGIINGTSNYILTRMSQDEVSFAQALHEAQQAGYAEPDPTADVEGHDALYKLQILTRFALFAKLDCASIERKGIADIDASDIALAAQCGCRLKHVAQARLDGNGHITASVGPVLVPAGDALYQVDGVQNAICVTGDLVGQLVFVGPGAGAFPTASAVLEDLVKVAQHPTPLAAFLDTPFVPTVVAVPSAEAFLVRHFPADGHLLGTRYNQYISSTLTAQDVTYVRLLGQHIEGWVIQGAQLTAERCRDAVQDCGAGVVVCYPFLGIPQNLTEAAARNAV